MRHNTTINEPLYQAIFQPQLFLSLVYSCSLFTCYSCDYFSLADFNQFLSFALVLEPGVCSSFLFVSNSPEYHHVPTRSRHRKAHYRASAIPRSHLSRYANCTTITPVPNDLGNGRHDFPIDCLFLQLRILEVKSKLLEDRIVDLPR